MINRLLGKKPYAKPVIVVETFVPQEYCSGCWYVEEGNCYNNLVRDVSGPNIIITIPGPNGRWNPKGDDQTLAHNHGTRHRLPDNSGFPYFKVEEYPIPTNINDYSNFYDYPFQWNSESAFHEKVTDTIYSVVYQNTTHYFKHINTNGHS